MGKEKMILMTWGSGCALQFLGITEIEKKNLLKKPLNGPPLLGWAVFRESPHCVHRKAMYTRSCSPQCSDQKNPKQFKCPEQQQATPRGRNNYTHESAFYDLESF